MNDSTERRLVLAILAIVAACSVLCVVLGGGQ